MEATARARLEAEADQLRIKLEAYSLTGRGAHKARERLCTLGFLLDLIERNWPEGAGPYLADLEEWSSETQDWLVDEARRGVQ